MNLNLPKISPGFPVPYSWYKAVESYLKAISLRPGVGVQLQESPGGTVVSVLGGRKGGSGGGGSGFTGIVDFKSGKRVVMTGASGYWVVVNLVNETALYDNGQPDGTAVRPFPANEVWVETGGISGNLQVW